MRLIFIYGLPATGKLTVGEHLAGITGFRLFHNHLAVDLLLSMFEFGSAPFVELREQIWLSVFNQASSTSLAGMIFTFNPENTVRPQFVPQAVETIQAHGGEIDFIELSCPIAEIRRRIANPSRQQYRKLSSLALFDELHAQGVFDTSHMPKPRLTIDTSLRSPEQAAHEIAAHLGLST